jgi:hypothetical protein
MIFFFQFLLCVVLQTALPGAGSEKIGFQCRNAACGVFG